jgi:methionine salvage enolase-phosphatase E1
LTAENTVIFDRGIDLIASKNGVNRYIQCKGWKYTSIIHESVVNELYAAVVSNVGQENLQNVEVYIYSPASLSNYAKAQADKLKVRFARRILPF